jgi:hypothetical protein
VPKAFWDWVWIGLFCVVVAALGFEALTASQIIPDQQQPHRPDYAKRSPESPSTAINDSHPSEQAAKRKEKQAQAAERALDFLNIKLSDAIIAVFTIVLAVKTSGVFKETAGLRSAADQQALDMKESVKVAIAAANAAKEAADHIPMVERAYLFGGPTQIEAFADSNLTKFKLSVDNAGKTPGIISEVCVSYSLKEPTGEPSYTDAKVSQVDFAINAGVMGQILPFAGGMDTIQPFFVAGYYRYIDIFRKQHTSRFCLRVHPDTRKFEIAGSRAWNDWD